MKALYLISFFTLSTALTYGQVGHVMQGVGASNMSMGGAATGQALDISGALQWNPASIAAFDETIIRVDAGLFFSSPEVSSTVPVFDAGGNPTGTFMSGITKDDRFRSTIRALL